jgi:hypothetical protein
MEGAHSCALLYGYETYENPYSQKRQIGPQIMDVITL